MLQFDSVVGIDLICGKFLAQLNSWQGLTAVALTQALDRIDVCLKAIFFLNARNDVLCIFARSVRTPDWASIKQIEQTLLQRAYEACWNALEIIENSERYWAFGTGGS